MGAVAGFAPSRDDVALAPLLPPGAGRPGARAAGRRCGSWRSCCSRRCWRPTPSRARSGAWRSAGATCCSGPRPPRRRPRRRPTCRRCCASTGACRVAGARAAGRAAGAARTPHPLLATRAVPGLGRLAGLDLVGQPAAAAAPRRRAVAGRPRLPAAASRATPGACSSAASAPQDNHLPPDNLQTAPHDMVAHRTSPTNIGLYLLATACARAFGWIGTPRAARRGWRRRSPRCSRCQRHRGHFLNWYDTADARAAAAACTSRPSTAATSAGTCWPWRRPASSSRSAPDDDAALRRAAARARQARIDVLRGAVERAAARRRAAPACSTQADPLAGFAADPAGAGRRLDDAARRAARRCCPRSASGTRRQPAAPRLRLGGSTTSWRRCARPCATVERGADGATSRRACGAVAATCQRLALRSRLQLPLPPQAPPVPHRLPRRRAAARRRLLRPAGLRGAR